MKTLLSLTVCMFLLASCSDESLVTSAEPSEFEATISLDASAANHDHKVDICHWADSNKVFKINIAKAAVPHHFANHGNGEFSDGYAGQGDYTDDCQVLQ